MKRLINRQVAIAAIVFTVLAALAMLAPAATASAERAPSDPIDCPQCKAWNRPVAPFNIVGNTWYVGVAGLSSILITSPQGHVLIDGGLPQSAALIEANVNLLGFRMRDVKLILNSHPHWDHAGGIAALQRASGATVAASASSALGLRVGTYLREDPQYDGDRLVYIPKVRAVKVLRDGQTIRVGPTVVTAILTPGHAPGGTTWTWQSCGAGACVDVVYADSLDAVSAGDYYFGGSDSWSNASLRFKASIATVAGLKCDVLLTPHPEQAAIFAHAAASTPAHNAFIDPGACRAYAANAAGQLEARLARERAAQ